MVGKAFFQQENLKDAIIYKVVVCFEPHKHGQCVVMGYLLVLTMPLYFFH